MKVELHHEHHLRWESLDIDLELESLADPDKYPSVFKLILQQANPHDEEL